MAAAGRPSRPAVAPETRSVPSSSVTAPVKVLLPVRMRRPEPALVIPPAPLARIEEIVSAFAFVVPPVTRKSSWPATEVVIVEPEIVAAPSALSCSRPPRAVAEAAVSESGPARERLAEAPAMRTELAATPPVVLSADERR